MLASHFTRRCPCSLPLAAYTQLAWSLTCSTMLSPWASCSGPSALATHAKHHHTQKSNQTYRCLHSSLGTSAAAAGLVATAVTPSQQATFPARLLDGRSIAAAWQEELAVDVQDVCSRGGRPPGLGVVLVGSRPDSLLYVARKREACERVGLFAEVRQLSASVTQRQLEAAVTALCRDPRIDGVLVQLPLPPHINEEDIIESFDPRKDVDGFHPINMGRMLMRGRAARFIPCTALGVMELLRRSGVAVLEKSVVVMGDSNIVGMPLAMLFRDEGAATVTVLHRASYRELFNDATSAEVVAVGFPHLVRREWVKPGAVVIDVGINVVQHGTSPSAAEGHAVGGGGQHAQGADQGSAAPGPAALLVGHVPATGQANSGAVAQHLEWQQAGFDDSHHDQQAFHVVGDVDSWDVAQVASALTPVPGGVGPMTIAAVLHNTVQAARQNLGLGSYSLTKLP